MADSSDGYKILSDNRQARFQYEILETFEAGLELKGTEVKSIRAGKANLRDGFAQVRGNEAWLHNVHISPHNTTIQ
ncbi:MAG: SsrA-binding protein, partial [Cyanobacteria bacterium P01_E01_bin.43]